MELRIYQVDAFTDRVFGGNPAAVVPLDEWLPAPAMQAIAMENNLAETTFYVPRFDGDYDLRWFTPAVEVPLCGHATLAAAWVLFNRLGLDGDKVVFHTRSGKLAVTRDGEMLMLDFPAQPPTPAEISDVAAALAGDGPRVEPEAVLASSYAMAVLDSEQTVLALRPDFRKVAALENPNLIVTAPGEDCDFVSRFFAPGVGIDEDPVTGSAHCVLVPYWAERLGKKELFARQISARGGKLWCALDGNRVLIAGQAAPYLEGQISIQLSEPAFKRRGNIPECRANQAGGK